MKTPRDRYEEKFGKKTAAIPGGKAAARQRQFEQERGQDAHRGKDERPDGTCTADEKGDET